MAQQSELTEIELLQKELEALRKQRTESPESEVAEQESETGEPLSLSSIEDILGLDEEEKKDLVEKFQDIIKNFDQDVKDMKPSTLLIIFALGVLVGRMR